MSQTTAVEEICDLIENENNMLILVQMAQKMDITPYEIQDFMIDHAQNLVGYEANIKLMRLKPIDHILPKCLLIYIEAYAHQERNEFISKSWCSYYQKNEDILRMNRGRVVEKYRLTRLYERQYTGDYDIWMVYDVELESEEYLTARKVAKFMAEYSPYYVGSVKLTSKVELALIGAKDGDKIFINTGNYVIDAELDHIIIRNKNLEIRALSTGVNVESKATSIFITGTSVIFMKEINFHFKKNLRDNAKAITLRDSAHVVLENCVFNNETDRWLIVADAPASRLYCLGGEMVGRMGIWMKGTENIVSVIDMTFVCTGTAIYCQRGKMEIAGCQIVSGLVGGNAENNENWTIIGNVVGRKNRHQILDEFNKIVQW